MADTRISDLTASGAVAATDIFYGVVTAGVGGVKATAAQLKTFMSASPTLVTPILGVAAATSINKVAITAPASGATLTIADGKTLTASNTLTFTGTDGSSVAFGAGGTVAYVANNLSVFAATTSAQLASIISDETGSGALVFATSPTLVTPVLGVAAGTSLVLNANVTAAPAPITGTSLLISPADGVTGRAQANGYGTIGAFTVARYNGTLASPTTVAPNDQLGSFNAYGYDGTALRGPVASVRAYITDTLSATAFGSKIALATAATGTTTLVDKFTIDQAGNATLVGSLNSITLTTPGSPSTLTLGSGKTITISNTLTFTGTDGSSVAFGAGGTAAYTGGTLAQFAATTSAQLAGVISDETGTGALVFGTAPTLTDKTTMTIATANTGVLSSTGYSLTGSNATNMVDLAGTWNTTGIPTAIKLNITNTASNAASLLMDLQIGGVSQFSVSKAGALVSVGGYTCGAAVSIAAASTLTFATRSRIASLADGNIRFQNSAGTNGFAISFPTALATPTLQLGIQDAAAPVAQIILMQGVVAGTSNTAGVSLTIAGSPGTGTGVGGSIIFQTAPAGSTGSTQNTQATVLTLNTTGVVVASGKTLTLGNAAVTGLAAGVLAATTNATITITDSTGQVYRIPCII